MVPVHLHAPDSLQRTVKADRNLLGRNDLHGNRLLIRAQVQILYSRPPIPPLRVFLVAVILAIALPPLARQYGVEFAVCGRGFGACFLLLLGFGVEAREQVADDKVGYQGLIGELVWAGAERWASGRGRGRGRAGRMEGADVLQQLP